MHSTDAQHGCEHSQSKLSVLRVLFGDRAGRLHGMWLLGGWDIWHQPPGGGYQAYTQGRVDVVRTREGVGCLVYKDLTPRPEAHQCCSRARWDPSEVAEEVGGQRFGFEGVGRGPRAPLHDHEGWSHANF